MNGRDLDLKRRAENELIRIAARRSPAPPVLAAVALETAAGLGCTEVEARHLYAQLSVLDPSGIVWDEALAAELQGWTAEYGGLLSPRLDEEVARASASPVAPPLPGLSQLPSRLFPIGLDAQRRLHHIVQASLASLAGDPQPPGVPDEAWSRAQAALSIVQPLDN